MIVESPTGTLTCDVVIVGSGAAALTGAYLAAAAGLDTVVLEKTPLLGGTSAYSGAACWLPGSQVQARADLDDSTEQARRYLDALIPDADQARLEAFLEAAPRLVTRLEQDDALEFEWQPFPDYFDAPGRQDVGRSIVPKSLPQDQLGELVEFVRPPVDRDRAGRGHPDRPLDGGRALIGRLLLALKNTGSARVLPSTPLLRLLTDDGRVTGVEADGSQGDVQIQARRGVLLAAGGFESDATMRTEYNAPGDARWTMGPDNANTGDAIRAAVEVGAATDLMGEGWWCPSLEQPGGEGAFLLGFRGGLMVDAEGRRFANESRPYDQMGRVMAEQPESRIPAYLLFDDTEGGRVPAFAIPEARAEQYLEAGRWAKADDVEELARRAGLPAETLATTVATFNEAAETGVDEQFHRGEDPYDRYFATATDRPNPCLVPLEKPPFYAARVVLGDLGTKGGLVVDPDGRVLDAEGAPIAGLYASSNTCASLSRHRYPGPGIPLGTSMATSFRAIESLLR